MEYSEETDIRDAKSRYCDVQDVQMEGCNRQNRLRRRVPPI